MKRLILILILLLNTPAYSIQEDPSTFLETVIETSRPALMQKNPVFLEETIEKYIDFNEIATWIAGKSIWTNSTDQQKVSFITELKHLMLKTYSKTVYHYVDADVTFITPKASEGDMRSKKRIQISSIMKKNNKNITISYRLIQHKDSWLVFDIMIEGISILKSLKTQYSEIIRIKGLDYATKKIKLSNG